VSVRPSAARTLSVSKKAPATVAPVTTRAPRSST
jgi:hypothetical protein